MRSGQAGLKRLNLYLDLKLITTQLRCSLTAYFCNAKARIVLTDFFISFDKRKATLHCEKSFDSLHE